MGAKFSALPLIMQNPNTDSGYNLFYIKCGKCKSYTTRVVSFLEAPKARCPECNPDNRLLVHKWIHLSKTPCAGPKNGHAYKFKELLNTKKTTKKKTKKKIKKETKQDTPLAKKDIPKLEVMCPFSFVWPTPIKWVDTELDEVEPRRMLGTHVESEETPFTWCAEETLETAEALHNMLCHFGKY